MVIVKESIIIDLLRPMIGKGIHPIIGLTTSSFAYQNLYNTLSTW